MALDKKDHIRKFLKGQLGDPIIGLCDSEGNAIDEAVEFASMEYWTSIPYVKKYAHTVKTGCGEASYSIPTYRDLLVPAPHNDDAFFIGIIREDLSTRNVPSVGHQHHFDRILLGDNVNYSPDNYPQSDPRYLADRVNYVNSTEDMLFGETDISIDTLTQEVVVVHPPVEGQLHLWWAWGFCAEKTIDKIPPNHLVLFRKMVAIHFIEMILASRTAVNLSNADFDVDSSDLRDKRDRLREEVDAQLPETALYVAQWG